MRQLLLMLALLALFVPAAAQATPDEQQIASAEGIAIDFKDIDLSDLIQTISELTGRNFVYDETVRGKATIISPRRMTLDEAYKVFLTVLNVKGYTVIPSGQVNKIVPIKDAKESNIPTVIPQRGDGRGEQYITRLIPLQHVDAADLATTVLSPLVPKTSNIVAYPATNTLIITDSAANIERLNQIIRQLDVPSSGDQIEVIELEHANAEEIAKLAEQLVAQQATRRPRRRATNVAAAAGATDVTKILPYPRTNVLVVMAPPEDMATIRDLILKLDRKASETRSGIQVYYLENADAETLAATMNEILTGIKTQTRTTAGRPGAQQQAEKTLEAVTITADKPTNSLIINSTPEEYETVREIISQLDIKRKQVYVEALILELSMDATKRLGASLQGAVDVGSDSLVFGTSNLNTGPATLPDMVGSQDGVPSLLGRTIEGILLGGLFNPITVIGPGGDEITVPALSALIDLSKTDSDINILSAPRLLTSDNEEAEIIVGSNVPIITSRLTDTGGTGLAQSVSVERKDVALTLRFTPQITEGNLVRLNVYQEITDISQQSVGNVNEVGPTFTKRLLRNTVLAENRRTVALGGLISTNIQESVSKVPLLGDIPVLGWLFKRKSTTELKTNLLIFITPHIIRTATDLSDVTQRAREAMYRFDEREKLDPDKTSELAEEFITIYPEVNDIPEVREK